MAHLICVWGSHSSGSTIFSIGLAKKFASQKQNVALVFPELNCPVIPTIYPQKTVAIGKNEVKSIGKLLNSDNLSYNDVIKQMVVVPQLKHLVLLGYAFGDNNLTYPNPSEEDVYSFFRILSDMVDVIIVDCSLNPDEMISSIALSNADAIIKCGDCSFKSVTYFASNNQIVEAKNAKEHIVVYPKLKSGDNTNEVDQVIGEPDYEIQYFNEIKRMANDGELLLMPYPPLYERVLDKIVKEMVLVG